MANWEKLNKEFDDALDSMTSEDWELWASKRVKQTTRTMKQITKSVIKLSEIPEHIQQYEILQGHKEHTYAEFHIDGSEQDELALWLLSQYPTLKRKTSFLIHIDQ
jgi:hypothetical protein